MDAATDSPDPDSVYRNHCETCRRLGVEAVPREHATELIAEWADVIPRGEIPPTKH